MERSNENDEDPAHIKIKLDINNGEKKLIFFIHSNAYPFDIVPTNR